jgi:hypothetical protein
VIIVVAQHPQSQTNTLDRIFETAQTDVPCPLVPCAWEDTRTESSNAKRPKHGTILQTPSALESAEYSPCETVVQSAATGNELQDAATPHMIAVTFVLDAPPPLMEHKSALERRKLRALTPYDPDTWEACLTKLVSLIDTLIFPKDSIKAFFLIFLSLRKPKFCQTKILFLFIIMSSSPSSNLKSKKKDTLAHVQQLKLRTLSAPSNHLPYRSSQNQVDRGNFASYKITHFLTHLPSNSLIHPSTRVLTQTTFPVPGEHSAQSHSLLAVYLQDLKWPQEMYRKHIEQYLCITRNGQPQLFESQMTNSALTLACALESPPQQESMVVLQMPDLTFLGPKVLAQRHDGLMTICSSVFEKNSLKHTVAQETVRMF